MSVRFECDSCGVDLDCEKVGASGKLNIKGYPGGLTPTAVGKRFHFCYGCADAKILRTMNALAHQRLMGQR